MAPTYAIAEKGAEIILSKPTSARANASPKSAAGMTHTWSSTLVGVVMIVASLFCV
jgi:hypothetical protein